jgi:deoxyribonuclease-4
MKRLMGAHMPTSGGLHQALYSGKEIGCTAVQIFTSSPQQWGAKQVTDEMAKQVEKAKKETGISVLISHDSYLINLAAPDPTNLKRSISALTGELHRCALLGIPFAVSHMGSHLGEGEDVGLKRLAESAKIVLDQSPKEAAIAMETTAGQGTNLGYKFEHLAYVIEKNKGNKRLVVCMDTCHIFASGYDIRNEKSFDKTIKEFDKIVGLDRLVAIHVNDSKYPLGSRKDRHEHIGKGEIGMEAFRFVVNDKRLRHAPLILETPDAEKMHKINLDVLKSLMKK